MNRENQTLAQAMRRCYPLMAACTQAEAIQIHQAAAGIGSDEALRPLVNRYQRIQATALPDIWAISTAEMARDLAIHSQRTNESISLDEIHSQQIYFEALAVKFPELVEEFAENGIIGHPEASEDRPAIETTEAPACGFKWYDKNETLQRCGDIGAEVNGRCYTHRFEAAKVEATKPAPARPDLISWYIQSGLSMWQFLESVAGVISGAGNIEAESLAMEEDGDFIRVKMANVDGMLRHPIEALKTIEALLENLEH